MIKVVCLRKYAHNNNNLRYFDQIRKAEVLEVLLQLKANNILYKDIMINFKLKNTQKDELNSVGIFDRVIYYDKDFYKRENYSANLKTRNYKNNLYYIINYVGISDSGLLNSCFYTNIDDIENI